MVNLLDTVVIGTGSGSLASERATQVQGSVHGDHLSQNLQALLGNCLIVDRDQILGLGVDLESLVESKSSLDVVRACRKGRIPVSNPLISTSSYVQDSPQLTLSTQALALGNLVHEVGLLLLQVGRETLLLGALHSLLDGITLGSTMGLLLFLDSLGELAVVPLQGLAEIGVGLSLVIKVHGVGYA